MRGARIGFIFQDSMTSLNPVFNVGFQVMEPLRKHMGLTKSQARNRAVDLLELVGIALACAPEVQIADEPAVALDVTIQAQILELVHDLRRKPGMAIVWITHDLGVIAGIADRVLVMYGGQVVEQGPVRELFANPKHRYTRALLETVPHVAARGPNGWR